MMYIVQYEQWHAQHYKKKLIKKEDFFFNVLIGYQSSNPIGSKSFSNLELDRLIKKLPIFRQRTAWQDEDVIADRGYRIYSTKNLNNGRWTTSTLHALFSRLPFHSPLFTARCCRPYKTYLSTFSIYSCLFIFTSEFSINKLG